MGNPLKKILPWIDPIGNQGAKAIANTTGLGAGSKTAPAAPGYDPSKNPGTQLFPNPGGGPAQGAPGTLFGPPGGNANAGYTPNPWLAAQQPPLGQGITDKGGMYPLGSLSAGGSAAPPRAPFTLPGGGPIFGSNTVNPPSYSNGGQGMPPSGPSLGSGIWLGRGGSSSQSQANNPALQRQMAIAQALRGPQMRVQ